MIEDVVGWILNADPVPALRATVGVITPPVASVAELVARLKSEDRAAGGLKQDQVAYEAIADVIGALEPSCRRARGLLNALSDVLLGSSSPMFADTPQGDPRVKILRP